MQKNQPITKLKQVQEIAEKLFPCIVAPVLPAGQHAKGYLGIKLAVGYKKNLAFDPNADPDKPGLTPEEKIMMKAKSDPRQPDVRVIWMPPGTTEEELINGWLLGIKKSLEVAEPIIDNTITSSGQEQFSDAELAAKLARGEKADVRFEDFNDGYEDENENDVPEEENFGVTDFAEKSVKEVFSKSETKEDTSGLENVLKQFSDNMGILAGDINKIADNLDKMEIRINELENKQEVPKRGRKPNK